MTICALCLIEKDLMKSHLIPSAAYKFVKNPPDKGGDGPVLVNFVDGTANFTDKQFQQHLLCSACERLFSDKGERLMGTLWSTYEKFGMLDMLNLIGAEAEDKRLNVYDPNKLDSKITDALFYFAVSVVWRSYAWDWRNKKHPSPKALGKIYSELFRQFLLEDKPLENVQLLLEVNTRKDLNGMISTPMVGRFDGLWNHSFHLLGMKFNLIVGQTRNVHLDAAFDKYNSNLILVAMDFSKSKELQLLSHAFQTKVIPRGRLAKSE